MAGGDILLKRPASNRQGKPRRVTPTRRISPPPSTAGMWVKPVKDQRLKQPSGMLEDLGRVLVTAGHCSYSPVTDEAPVEPERGRFPQVAKRLSGQLRLKKGKLVQLVIHLTQLTHLFSTLRSLTCIPRKNKNGCGSGWQVRGHCVADQNEALHANQPSNMTTNHGRAQSQYLAAASARLQAVVGSQRERS